MGSSVMPEHMTAIYDAGCHGGRRGAWLLLAQAGSLVQVEARQALSHGFCHILDKNVDTSVEDDI